MEVLNHSVINLITFVLVSSLGSDRGSFVGAITFSGSGERVRQAIGQVQVPAVPRLTGRLNEQSSWA
ncbi:hypothetical protein SAMN05446635_6826 [Burkholderia sp. OK233]|nr:hypothetical protein SAMN05446635_6826 [Burkholderia sp. OK233]